MKRKALALMTVGTLLAGLLTGCGDSASTNVPDSQSEPVTEPTTEATTEMTTETPSPATTEEGKNFGDYVYQDLEDAEISFFNFSVENKELYEKEIAAYMAVHPNIKVNLDLVGGDVDARTALKAKISSGDAPNIICLEGASDLATFGYLLDDLSDQPWVEHVFPSSLKECTVDGKVVALPAEIVSYGLLYNKGIFEACGIDGDTLRTYDDIDAAFATVQEAINNGDIKEQYPDLEAVVSLPAKEWWVLGNHSANAALGMEFGSSLEAYDADTLDFTYADAYKDYIDLMVKYSPDADNPSALVAADYDSAMGGSFCIEKTAVIQMGQWVQPVIAEINPELLGQIGVLPIPLKGVDENNICYGIGSLRVVNKDASDAERAASKDFLNWLFMSDEGKAFSSSNTSIPMDNYEDFQVANEISRACDVYARSEDIIALIFGSCPDGWNNFHAAGIQSYIAGDKTWDEVIDEAKAEWSKLRKK